MSTMGTISVLLMEDGSDIAEIDIKVTNDTVVHPPIVVGDSFLYLLTQSLRYVVMGHCLPDRSIMKVTTVDLA